MTIATDQARQTWQQQRMALSHLEYASQQQIEAVWGTLKMRLGAPLRELRSAAAEKGVSTLSGSSAVRRVQNAVRSELPTLSKVIGSQGPSAQARAGTAGRAAGIAILGSVLKSPVKQPPAGSTAAYVGSQAWKAILAGFATGHADRVGQIVSAGEDAGKSPVTIAAQISNYFEQAPAIDAERAIRTLLMYSFRQAALDSYRANDDVVTGWMWSAALDSRCCMSCVAMHGTIHGLDEDLNDHDSGRCAAVPITQPWAQLGFKDGQDLPDVQSGEDWFAEQDAKTQQAMMGGSAWRAWQDGAFDLSDYPTDYQSDLYGTMRREASLNELIGAEKASKYKRAK